MLLQKYLAELLGTFTLTLAVILSLSFATPLIAPVAAALTLGLFVYTVGHLSGAHLNPAVTLGILSVKKIKVQDAGFYVLAQLIGSALALFSTRTFLDILVQSPAGNSIGTGIAEALGTFFLVFGVLSVVSRKTPPEAAGIVVGGSLLLGIFLSGSFSGGILNPAVALGLSSLTPMYVLGPIAGAIAGAWTYVYLTEKH